MAEEKKSIFRQKSLDRISSPEELDQYLQVTKPGTWIVLAAIVAFLLGFVAWGFMGHLHTTLPVAITVDADGRALCLVPIESQKMEDGTEVTVGEESYQLKDTGLAPMVVDESMDISLKLAGGLTDGTVVQPLEVNADLPKGSYEGEIVVNSITPISFILN